MLIYPTIAIPRHLARSEDLSPAQALTANHKQRAYFAGFSRITNEVIGVLAATTLVVALIDLYAQSFPAVITGSVAALQADDTDVHFRPHGFGAAAYIQLSTRQVGSE